MFGRSRSTIEELSSSEWVGDMREQLADIVDTGLTPTTLPEDERRLPHTLSNAVVNLMLELGATNKPIEISRTKSGVNKVDIISQFSSPTFAINYHPYDEHDNLTILSGEKNYARAVVIRKDRFQTRQFIPLILGKVALKEKLETSVYRGVEFNINLPVHPDPFDADPFWAYCTVNEQGSGMFLPRWHEDDGGVKNVGGLIEGLHAIATSAGVSVYQKTRT